MMVYGDKNVVVIEKRCPFCGQRYTVSVPTDGFVKWQEGELIQIAMPDVPASSREFLISGICRDCQDEVFGTEEDE